MQRKGGRKRENEEKRRQGQARQGKAKKKARNEVPETGITKVLMDPFISYERR